MLKRLMAMLLAALLCLGSAQAEITKTLRRGSQGSEVTELQDMLRELGLYTIAVDGRYGKGTVGAVKAFQREAGLKADGIAGPLTLGALYDRLETRPEATAQPSPAATPGPTAVPAAIAYPTLSSGSRSDAVRTLQTVLKRLGYYTKSIDGIYGRGTAAAVEAYQRSAGLPGTGVADSQTQLRLFGTATTDTPSATAVPAVTATPTASLRLGDSGDAVAQLQTKLWYLGYHIGSLGGEFDQETRTAVLAFQKAEGLTRDGIAGKKTLAALDAAWLAARETDSGLPDEAAALLNQINQIVFFNPSFSHFSNIGSLFMSSQMGRVITP